MQRWSLLLALLGLLLLPGGSAGPRYSARIVQTKHGPVRGVILQLNSRRLEPVEVFRGLPYAAAPVGPLRFVPAQPPPPWTGTRLADTFGSVCPQRMPDINNRTAAMQVMPRGRMLHLKKLVPFLNRQSEDCLYLNLYVPASAARGPEASVPYPVIVFIHGESYEWNAGSPYDGSVLASWGHVIVLTFNYRLGVLGFLRTRLGSQELDLGTGDIHAVLRWVQSNAATFGGDPRRVTLLGHDTGAALASILLLHPSSKGLFQHVVLMSGSVLSPWASSHNPWDLRETVSRQMGCHVTAPGDPDLAPCLRKLPLEALLSLSIEPPRFLPRFGPSIPFPGLDPVRIALDQANDPFVRCALLMGTHTTESYDDFNNQDIQYGFEEDQRNRVLRTFVRNAYVFHLNEIFSTVRNEYTDWERPVAHPINLRDNTLEALSDGHTVAPLMQLARLHARRGAPTYFFHFGHQTRDSLYPQRLGSVRGEALPYLLGLPLVLGEPHFPHNYSRQDMLVAEATIAYICNFAKTGNPNDPLAEKQASSSSSSSSPSSAGHRAGEADEREGKARFKDILWSKYEMSTQLYLSITQKPRLKSHYRSHRMAVWLDLIPQLHRAGGQDVGMRHHHFHEKGDRYFSGSVRGESSTQFPPAPEFLLPAPTATVECAPLNVTGLAVEEPPSDAKGNVVPTEEDDREEDDAGLLQKFSAGHFFTSSLALGVTLGAGGLLLLLNVVVLIAILYQRAKRARRRKRDPVAEDGSSSASGGASPGPGPATPLTALGVTTLPRCSKQNGPLDVLQVGGPVGPGPPRYGNASAPVPAPPPPPRAVCPPPIVVPPVGTVEMVCGSSTQRTGAPGPTKKRVQIQEISV